MLFEARRCPHPTSYISNNVCLNLPKQRYHPELKYAANKVLSETLLGFYGGAL